MGAKYDEKSNCLKAPKNMISVSNSQCEDNSIRDIQARIKLSNRLFSANTIKQFLGALYKETSGPFKIKSFVLCWHSGHFGRFQYVYSKEDAYKRQPTNLWPKRFALGLANVDVRRYIASELGRPVQRILIVPIFLKKYSAKESAVLFVEFFTANPIPLQRFYQTFLNCITVGLDRLLLQDHLQTGSDLLYSTFNHLKEPLAVLDQDHQINSSNKMFDQMGLLENTQAANNTQSSVYHISQKVIHWNHRVYERYSYPARIKDSVYTIYHYVDVTESLALRSQMIQSEKMSALGKLGEEIAHELNNPLTGILSMAQLLLHSRQLTDDLTQDIDAIALGARRSQKIISHLLDFARSSSQQLHECNLNLAVQNTLSFLKSVTCQVDFQIQLCKKPIFVKAQLCLLQQVVFNLIKNACQAAQDHFASRSDQARVTVSVGKVKDSAFVSVEDNGPGIKNEDYNIVFKPFFTTKQKHQGTGLGLNVSMNIVESFNGSLKPSRSVMGGACFTLQLPING